MPKLRNGHAPGHVRETAGEAFEAWMDWDGVLPELTVEYEVHYVPKQIPISQALGLVWNCNDIVPGGLFDWLHDALEAEDCAPKTRTYGACARAILTLMKRQAAA